MTLFDKPKKAEILVHWYALVPDFNASTQEFYHSIEQELQDRQVPGLEISRIEFSEGGPLAPKREYLRMYRERLVFDVCAASFGTSYFYSMRFAEIPSILKISDIVVASLILIFFFGIVWHLFGFWLGSILLIFGAGIIIWLARNLVSLGLQDLDASLIKIPVIGPIYERFFRKETYYRIDTRLMYFESVNAIVKRHVEEITSAKGVKLLTVKEHSPLALYKEVPLRNEDDVKKGDVAAG